MAFLLATAFVIAVISFSMRMDRPLRPRPGGQDRRDADCRLHSALELIDFSNPP